MRAFAAAIAICGLFATIVQAADDSSPIAGQFPDTATSAHVYLFMLKKNGISMRIEPDEFCKRMDYGDWVPEFGHRALEPDKDGRTVVKGDLEWVICRFQKVK
jgi:hypothetical protein